MNIIETERLTIRRLTAEDDEFIYELLNEPAWLKNIGDKRINSHRDAREYIDSGPIAMYQQHGIGLYRVALKLDDQPIGVCGLIKRDELIDVDIGFAFLSAFWGNGYAYESAVSVIAHERRAHHLSRIVAITLKENVRSSDLLARLGFRFERVVQFKDDPDELDFYALVT